MRILPMELGNKVSRIVAWKFWTTLWELRCWNYVVGTTLLELALLELTLLNPRLQDPRNASCPREAIRLRNAFCL
jgi:hypothetical protein